jgi:flagellin-like protein
MIFTNKRGISPLVATILLIAFAVSIGALIMNWSSSAESSSALTGEGGCSDIEISILDSCQTDTEISLSLKNNGNSAIEAIILRSSGANRVDYFISSSLVGANTNKDFEISKVEFNSDNFMIIPTINSKGNELFCTSKSIRIPSLSVC